MEAFLSYVFDQTMAINIFDENGHILKVNLSANECSQYQNADSVKRKEKESPGFISRCLAALGPNQPGVTTADPSDTGVEDPGHEPHPPGGRSSKRSKRDEARKPDAKSRNTAGQPDLKKALERLLRGGGGANKPSVSAPALPNVTAPNSVPAPSLPNANQGTSQSAPDPQALLDYLLSP